MSLSSNEAVEAAKNPPNQSQVKKGEEYQSRLRILTEAYSRDSIQKQSAWRELDTYLSNTLASDKYAAVRKYWTFPMPIVNISNDIMTDIYTVFNGRNASFDIDYPNERFKEIATSMLSELNIRQWIEEKGKKVLKSAPNSLAVVDINLEGNPVLLLVQNEQIKGYKLNKDGSFKFVVFLHSAGMTDGKEWKKWAVYDNEFYRVVLEQSGTFNLEIENAHNLGYTPATFFYNKPLLNKLHFDRSVPLTNTMGVMSQWQLFDLFIWYAEHYGTFPIVEFADSGCDNEACVDGIIQPQPILNDLNEVVSYSAPIDCPSCAKKKLIGPGTSVGIEVSEDADVQDTRGLLRFITPEVSSLEYLQTRQADKENFIKINTVGFNNAVTKEAVNEQQVRALVESRKKPLLEIKEHLNELYKWLVKTVIKLMFDTEVNVSADFGTEFFILTEKDILLLIQEAKKAGVQSGEIAELNKLLIETKYKNNPFKAQKLMIQADLEPSPFDTREEVEKKFNAGMITATDYYIKLNFTDLIRRFERENGSIIAFGAELPYNDKINRIKNTLIFYTSQNLESNGDNETEPTTTGATGITDNQ